LDLSAVTVLVRGAGEMASGIAHRLHRCHFKVAMTEVPSPTAIRRMVAFAEAVYSGRHRVEGVEGVRVAGREGIERAWEEGAVAVLVDAEARIAEELRPEVLVDAIMAKRNCGTWIGQAPLVIAVGPGFQAGVDAHAVIESQRGHHLGRVLWEGYAEANTGTPAPIEGYAEQRVLRAPVGGWFRARRAIGDCVRAGEIVGEVDGEPLVAAIPGCLRGLLKDGIRVERGAKAADIDPRGRREYCYQISDKARAIAGGVLEAILQSLGSGPRAPREFERGQRR
jgi:xanthine dehydrogenase accessory factor